ncbi:MAG: methionine--tRNA ligase [Erysipelotrichaceae bacterium]|nr:methionine--tRNA ligase [Erysipelotrichaceae bacterium]
MCRKCYVTTPIYYASGTPQLGNSYSTVACDVFARFNRLMNRDTFYLTGMDEHGQKIEEVAAKAKMDPQSFTDKIAEGTKEVWKNLNISYDYFIRTTDDNHVKAVQMIFEKLLANKDIYLGSYTGNYCVSCETFFTKSQLAEGDTCPDCGKETKLVSEESYFLNLKKYSDRLLKYIADNPNFIVPETRKNEVVSFIESGLEDLCVSRTTFKWGVPVVSNPKHVVYVWIDALANYITALGYGSDNDANFKKYWLENNNIYHVIGKDILRFHAIYWPIMLMALDIPINFQLIVHGWILNRDGKMSKSRGNAVYPEDLYSRYGSDCVRYYLAKEMPLGNDGLFSYDRFMERYNTDLANDLGNLVSRTVSMIEKYFNGVIPSSYKNTEFDASLQECANRAITTTISEFEKFELQNAMNATWELINRANKYVDETAPWTLAKDPANKDLLASVMYHLAESIRVAANLVAPYLVETAPKILEQLGIKEELCLENLKFGANLGGIKVCKGEALFKRLDIKAELKFYEEKQKAALEALNKAKKEEPKKELITIDDFAKVELKVGEILESKRHENAEKLLVSKIKIGDEVRQIVSGIAKHYDPATLVGRKVIVVTNLQPVKIRGVESNGMVLCAADGDKLELIEIKEAESGSIVR